MNVLLPADVHRASERVGDGGQGMPQHGDGIDPVKQARTLQSKGVDMFSLAISLGPAAEPADGGAGGAAGSQARILDLTGQRPRRAGVSGGDRDGVRIRGCWRTTGAGRIGRSEEAVCRYYAARGRTGSAGRVLLTAARAKACGYLFKLLTDPGGEVLPARRTAVRVSRRYGVGGECGRIR